MKYLSRSRLKESIDWIWQGVGVDHHLRSNEADRHPAGLFNKRLID